MYIVANEVIDLITETDLPHDLYHMRLLTCHLIYTP